MRFPAEMRRPPGVQCQTMKNVQEKLEAENLDDLFPVTPFSFYTKFLVRAELTDPACIRFVKNMVRYLPTFLLFIALVFDIIDCVVNNSAVFWSGSLSRFLVNLFAFSGSQVSMVFGTSVSFVFLLHTPKIILCGHSLLKLMNRFQIAVKNGHRYAMKWEKL